MAVVGDFFLDRYLHIDPSRDEVSIETGLTVYNVVEVRPQPGAAGTILNNLVALGIGEIHAVGFCGDDGEGYELRRALAERPGVVLEDFLTAPSRRTPVYCKPMVIEPGRPPRELNRLDSKNWTPTPEPLQRDLAERVRSLAGRVDAILLMDQVDRPETGVVTEEVRRAAHAAIGECPGLVVLADSRRGLGDFPPVGFKMNAAELARMTGALGLDLDAVRARATELAGRTGQPVFVSMAERGIVGAAPGRPAGARPCPAGPRARSTSSAPATPSRPTWRRPWPRVPTSARRWSSPWPPPRSSSTSSAPPGRPRCRRSPDCSGSPECRPSSDGRLSAADSGPDLQDTRALSGHRLYNRRIS